MESYLDALDRWEALEEDYEVLSLPDNPTIAQIKNKKERKMRKSQAKAFFVYCRFIDSLYPNHVTQISKSNLGLSQNIV